MVSSHLPLVDPPAVKPENWFDELFKTLLCEATDSENFCIDDDIIFAGVTDVTRSVIIVVNLTCYPFNRGLLFDRFMFIFHCRTATESSPSRHKPHQSRRFVTQRRHGCINRPEETSITSVSPLCHDHPSRSTEMYKGYFANKFTDKNAINRLHFR